MNMVTCDSCGAPMSLTHAPAVTANAGKVSVTLTHLPMFVCSVQGHNTKPVDPDFGAKTTDAIFFSGNVAIAKRGAFSRKCVRCGAKLSSPLSTVGSVSGMITVNDVHTFTIGIHGPVLKCGECGTVQVEGTRETDNDVSNAYAEALRMAGLNI